MKQTFVKAAIMASFMAAVSCGQAPTEQGPAQYGVTTIATTDREIQSNYSATIRGRQDIDIYPQVSGTISELRVTEGQSVSKGQTLTRQRSRQQKPMSQRQRPAWQRPS